MRACVRACVHVCACVCVCVCVLLIEVGLPIIKSALWVVKKDSLVKYHRHTPAGVD